MRNYFFVILTFFFLIPSGCSSQLPSFMHDEVASISIEGCGLDGFFNENTSTCERELNIEEKQDIETFLEVLETAAAYDGPLTAEGNNFMFTIVEEDGKTTEYEIWLDENSGSFEKSTEDDTRYLMNEEEAQQVFEIIKQEMEKMP